MKIGLVLPYNITKGGGVKEIVLELQKGLKKRGHEVVIVTPRPRNVKKQPKDVIFVGAATDFRSPLATTLQISATADAIEIDEMLEKEKFDVLHFHEPWVPFLSRQILNRSNAVNIATFHAKLPETVMSRTMAKVVTPYTKSILKYLHEFTAVSEAAQDYLSTMSGEPVTIIPNGINTKQFHAPRDHKEHENKAILYVGRLEKRKGAKYLLRAFADLQSRHSNIKLLLAGDGEDRAKLELLAEELGISNNIKFLGYISDARKKKLLRDSDLFCSPAIYGESFGVVLLEAMASGLVTVAGNNPGYSAVMKGLGSVSLVNPRDTTDFSKRLELLLYETELRRLWRKWAKESIPQYDYDQVVEQYEAVYKKAFATYK